jgi:hypothetical protein
MDTDISEVVKIYTSYSEMKKYNLDKAAWERYVLYHWDIYFGY